MSDSRLKNKAWRISNLYRIRDKEKSLVKFKRNRAQEHYSQNLHTRNLILKSRQLGFTTDESIDSLDDVLFTPNLDALLIAHDLDAGTAIFDKKINLAWDKLNPSLKALYKVDTSTSKTLKFDFGEKGFSSIAVDTNGRSGTYHRVHITEFAEICKKYPKKALDIIEGTIPAIPTSGRLDIESTSQGASGEFYEMFIAAKERGEPQSPQDYKAHFYNWTWDDAEMLKITDPLPFNKMEQGERFQKYALLHKLNQVQITYYYQKWISLNRKWNSLKREYPTTAEEAFEAITEGTYYGETIALMEQDGRIGILPYDRGLKVHTVWDLGVGKNLVVGFFQRDTISNRVRLIDYWQGQASDAIPEAATAIFRKPYVYGRHFGPHDIDSTEVSTGKTRREVAKKLGITFTGVPDVSLEDGIEGVGVWLDRVMVDKEKCKEWIRAMKNYCHEWDDKRGMYKDEPLHNWASHGADMSRYASLVESSMTNEMFNPNQPFHDKMLDVWRA